MKKYKKTKPSDWSPRYLGYRAFLDREVFTIIAHNEKTLRKIHKVIFPDLRFRPMFIHPANIRRIGD